MELMESGNGNLKRKRSGEVEPSKENKKNKISKHDIPTQGLNATCSMEAKEKTCEKKQDIQLKKFKRREKNVDKARDPGTNNDSPKSKTGSAQQIAIDKACDPCSSSQKKLNSEKLLKENRSSLRARVKELMDETHRLCYELEGLSEICMLTRESNRNLLENLKMICGPEIIQALEEKNPDPDPDPDPQTDDCRNANLIVL